jgi:hypothetical protein
MIAPANLPPRQGGVRFGGMGPKRANRGPPSECGTPVENFDGRRFMLVVADPPIRALPCAFATRRFEDGSAAFQMEPWRPWELVTAPGFPVGTSVTARRFVRWRNRVLGPMSAPAIFVRTAIRGAWRPYQVLGTLKPKGEKSA